MNKQSLIDWLESNLNRHGFKVQLYADETMLSVYNDSLGMVAVGLVMKFKKTTGTNGGINCLKVLAAN